MKGLNKQNTIYYAKLKSKMAAATKWLITIFFYQYHQYGYQIKGLDKKNTVHYTTTIFKMGTATKWRIIIRFKFRN